MSRFDFSTCPGYCERARQIMVRQSHPLIVKRDEEPKPCLLAADQALATYLEMKEEGKAPGGSANLRPTAGLPICSSGETSRAGKSCPRNRLKWTPSQRKGPEPHFGGRDED